jgi:gamma-butyrobetaine hydroxylase
MGSNLCTEVATRGEVSHDDRHLHIIWADGHKSTFDSLWLRDNCPTDRDPETQQRLADIADLPPDPVLISVYPLDERSLAISWADETRGAQFSLAWLRQNCYCDQHPRTTTLSPILWRGSAHEIRRMRYSEVLENQDAQRSWLTSLVRYGLAFLSEVPREDGIVLSVAALAGYVTETNYGRVFDVRSVPDPNNLAYTDAGLGLHTDNPYRDPVPGFQFLHCLQCSDEGGESLFADGFALAADLKARDPQAFATLSRTPVGFVFEDVHSHLTAEQPLIALDHRGDVAAIHYNNRSIAPLALVRDQMQPFYRAYRVFSQMLRDSQYVMRLRLQPGDLVAFYNRRVLHGRTGFRNGDAMRLLQGCYVSQDGVFSKLAILQRDPEKPQL